MNRTNLAAALVLAAVVVLHAVSIPRTIWEYDENLYAMGVERFEPLLHHPPPPGSPLFIGFGKLIPADPFHALVVTSMLAVVAGLIFFALAFRAISGSLVIGVTAAVVLYTSPALLVSGPLPQADAGALALFGLAVWMCARGNPIAMGLACAAAVGWRLQFSIAVGPMFLFALFLLRTWRERFLAVCAFGAGCLAWFVPLVMSAGGPLSYWRWLSGQTAYYAQHDSDISRSGYSSAQIALRFLAHPWGPKWLSIPLLLLAAAAPASLPAGPLRSNRRVVFPLLAGCLVYLAFALATMDPADAVRYAIPALPLLALFAAVSIRRASWLAVAYAAGAVWYAYPILHARATSDSPPFAAAQWIRTNIPRNTVVVFDAPLRPHAENLLRGFAISKPDVDPSRSIVLYTDGERGDAPGVTFRWPDTDSYRKLTRQHYGAVSVIPVPAHHRFRAVEGIYAPERLRDGTSWRWLATRGVLTLPELGATRVRVAFRTPPEYPFESNRVRVGATIVTVRRNASAEVIVPYSKTLTIEPERSFVPARIAGANNRDPRTLSVMLTKIEQLDSRPAAR